MTKNKIEEILIEFEKLPKSIKEPTFLEICQYPHRRFEEICSRIICFYLDPKNEHGLTDLFISSFLNLLSQGRISLKNKSIKVISEVNSEGKRLDILAYNNEIVIGIENKITAPIYNPLEKYKDKIDLYGTDNIFRVVLSLKRISDKNETEIIKSNGFQNITYQELFTEIKTRIGSYLNQVNSKYLTFLTDFIQTLENMNNENVLNDELSDYFFDKSIQITSLISLYERYKTKTLDLQIQRISDLKEKITSLTNNNRWWAWKGWDLGFDKFNPNKPNIGIESNYVETKGNALGQFKIYIVAWDHKDWAFYQERLLKEFPNKFIDKVENKTYLHLDVIDNDNEELILNRLKGYYDYLVRLTKDN